MSAGIVLLFSRTFGTRWGGDQPYAAAASTPGKAPLPIVQGLGGPHGRSGLSENLVPTGFDPGPSSP